MRRLLLPLLLLAALLAACAQTGERPQPFGLRKTIWRENKIVWENRGDSPQALVFVHGWAGDHTLFEKQMDSLYPWRRIAVDLPGHGGSDCPRIAYRVDTLVEALLAVLDDAQVARAVLVGHANGAILVRRFLELHPERVAGLVLVDGPIESFFASPAQARKFVEPLFGPDWKAWTAKTVDGMLAGMHDAADRRHVREVTLATPQFVLRSSFEGTLEKELWSEQPIRVPLMLVLARQPVWDESYRARATRIAPQLRWEMLEGVSHFLMLDAPDRFDALMRSFLIENAPFAQR